MRAECIAAKLGGEERNLTMVEKVCVFTSSDDDVEDLIVFVAERLQCLSEGSVEKLIGDECVNGEEILCGNVGVKENGGDKSQSVCPNSTIDGDIDVEDRRFSPSVEINQISREELGSANVTSTPKRDAWHICTKRRSSGLRELDEPVCDLYCLMLLGEVKQLEALNCQEGMLLIQMRVCLRVS